MAVIELHVMAVWCNSSLPRPRPYVKWRWGSGGCVVPKGATQVMGDLKRMGFRRSRVTHSRAAAPSREAGVAHAENRVLVCRPALRARPARIAAPTCRYGHGSY